MTQFHLGTLYKPTGCVHKFDYCRCSQVVAIEFIKHGVPYRICLHEALLRQTLYRLAYSGFGLIQKQRMELTRRKSTLSTGQDRKHISVEALSDHAEGILKLHT